jgi:hypothetical protein
MAAVTEELHSLRGQGLFQPYRAPNWAGGEKAADGVGKTSHDRGAWNVFYLQLHDAAEFTGAYTVGVLAQLLINSHPYPPTASAALRQCFEFTLLCLIIRPKD